MSTHSREDRAGGLAAPAALPPRVLVVVPEQWPRAMLRAALREVGYDAIGARTLREALVHPAQSPARGPVRALIVEQSIASDVGPLDALRSMHHAPVTILLAHPTRERPEEGRWDLVLSRPFSIADVVTAVERALPLPAANRAPIDRE